VSYEQIESNCPDCGDTIQHIKPEVMQEYRILCLDCYKQKVDNYVSKNVAVRDAKKL